MRGLEARERKELWLKGSKRLEVERKWGFCSGEEIKLKNIKFNLSEFVVKKNSQNLSINMPCLDF